MHLETASIFLHLRGQFSLASLDVALAVEVTEVGWLKEGPDCVGSYKLVWAESLLLE